MEEYDPTKHTLWEDFVRYAENRGVDPKYALVSDEWYWFCAGAEAMQKACEELAMRGWDGCDPGQALTNEECVIFETRLAVAAAIRACGEGENK